VYRKVYLDCFKASHSLSWVKDSFGKCGKLDSRKSVPHYYFTPSLARPKLETW